MSTTGTALTARLVRAEVDWDGDPLHRITREIRERFDIGHAPVQFETPEIVRRCERRSDKVV
jgi:hypothetical protein